MKKAHKLIFFVFLFAVYSSFLSAEPPFSDITISSGTVDIYEPVSFSVKINEGLFNNPFDFSEAHVQLLLYPRRGNNLRVDFFYDGNNTWKARHTPSLPGQYGYRIAVRTNEHTYYSERKSFIVKSKKFSDGFIARSRKNNQYFIFVSGKPFFGIGHNVAWVKGNDPAIYEDYFRKMRENGCNMTRIWINSPWTINLEPKKLSNYNLRDAAKLDKILSLAEDYGIYVILTLDSYCSLMDKKGQWGENAWRINPYNKSRGGMCLFPRSFFTDPEARRYYKNRLRYIVARWAYSPNILAFELWNETEVPAVWMRNIVSYIKKIDPYDHLLTTSPGSAPKKTADDKIIWNMCDLDFIQLHIYGNNRQDPINRILDDTRSYLNEFDKPVLIGEFGSNASVDDSKLDKKGDAKVFHDSLWAAALSSSCATPLNWWWDTYIRAKDLYPHYAALYKFLKDVEWDTGPVNPVKIESQNRKNLSPAEAEKYYDDIDIYTVKKWGVVNSKEFVVKNNGDIRGGEINYYLHGYTKNNYKTEPELTVDFPAGGKIFIHIDMVSQGGKLFGYLDGARVIYADLPCGPGKGAWAKSIYNAEHDIYQCAYDKTFSVNVPRGRHKFKLENAGMDWIGIDKITLTNYRDKNNGDLRAVGLRVDKDILIWVSKKSAGKGMCKNVSFDLENMDEGDYSLEFWDTHKGEVTSSKAETVGNTKNLMISLPDFEDDIACKVRKK